MSNGHQGTARIRLRDRLALHRTRRALAGMATALLCSAAGAQEPAAPLPRWEFGASLVAAHLRDYPGSSHSSTYALPLPWFVWRSERLEIARDGGRGLLYRGPRSEVALTVSANPPSSSGDNPERAGMQKLDAVVEPGLRLRWRYPLDDEERWWLGLHLPLRYALRMNTVLDYSGLGLHSEPGVSLDHRFARGWSWGISAAAGYADAGYSDYYYGVDPVDATATRPVYHARGGYAGWQAGARLSWHSDNLGFGLFTRYENIADAAFADSPLVSRDDGLTVGGSINWRIFRSRDNVGDPRPPRSTPAATTSP